MCDTKIPQHVFSREMLIAHPVLFLFILLLLFVCFRCFGENWMFQSGDSLKLFTSIIKLNQLLKFRLIWYSFRHTILLTRRMSNMRMLLIFLFGWCFYLTSSFWIQSILISEEFNRFDSIGVESVLNFAFDLFAHWSLHMNSESFPGVWQRNGITWIPNENLLFRVQIEWRGYSQSTTEEKEREKEKTNKTSLEKWKWIHFCKLFKFGIESISMEKWQRCQIG